MYSTFALTLLALWGVPAQATDGFWENVDSTVVKQLLQGARELKRLSFAQAVSRRSPFGAGRGLLLLVQTDQSAWGVLECQFAARKRADRVFPVVFVRRFALVRPTGGIAVSRERIEWFAGLELDCDIGQVVPPAFGGDLGFSGDRPDDCAVVTRGDARLWIVDRLPRREPSEAGTPKQGPARYSGRYKLFADGEFRGTLELQVSDQGIVRGMFVSAETGQQYAVRGRFGGPEYRLQARITFPRSVQDLDVYFWRRLSGVATGLVHAEEHVYGVLLAKPGAVELPETGD